MSATNQAEQLASDQSPAEIGPGGVPKGAVTSDWYRTKNIPPRFDHPGKCYSGGNPVFSCTMDVLPQKLPQTTGEGSDWFQGYKKDAPVNPMYRTTNTTYGGCAPSVHTMPTTFHAKSQKFTEHLGKTGMYRNHSLNTALDTCVVPDH